MSISTCSDTAPAFAPKVIATGTPALRARIQVELVDADAPFVQQLQLRRSTDHVGVYRNAGQDEIRIGHQRQMLAPVSGCGETNREAVRQFGADFVAYLGVHDVEEGHPVGHRELRPP